MTDEMTDELKKRLDNIEEKLRETKSEASDKGHFLIIILLIVIILNQVVIYNNVIAK